MALHNSLARVPVNVRLASPTRPRLVGSSSARATQLPAGWSRKRHRRLGPSTRSGLRGMASARTSNTSVTTYGRRVRLLRHFGRPVWCLGDPLMRQRQGNHGSLTDRLDGTHVMVRTARLRLRCGCPYRSCSPTGKDTTSAGAATHWSVGPCGSPSAASTRRPSPWRGGGGSGQCPREGPTSRRSLGR